MLTGVVYTERNNSEQMFENEEETIGKAGKRQGI